MIAISLYDHFMAISGFAQGERSHNAEKCFEKKKQQQQAIDNKELNGQAIARQLMVTRTDRNAMPN